MSNKYWDKDNIKSIEFGPAGSWAKATDPDKTRTYMASADGATIKIKFKDGTTTQDHTGLKSGSSVIVHTNGQVEIEELL